MRVKNTGLFETREREKNRIKEPTERNSVEENILREKFLSLDYNNLEYNFNSNYDLILKYYINIILINTFNY